MHFILLDNAQETKRNPDAGVVDLHSLSWMRLKRQRQTQASNYLIHSPFLTDTPESETNKEADSLVFNHSLSSNPYTCFA